MKALVQLGIAVVAGVTALPAWSAEETRVSVNARGEPLRATLKKLTAGTPTVITVDPKIPDVPVRMALREVTLDHALRLITRQASREIPQLTYEATEQGFRLFLAAPAHRAAPPEDPNKIMITVRKQPKPEPAPQPVEDLGTGPEPGQAGETASPEGGAFTIPEQSVPGPDDFFAPPGSIGGAGPYLIEPVAPLFLRRALEPPPIDYRSGYLIPGLVGKNKRFKALPRPKEGIWYSVRPLSGTYNSGRYGASPWTRRRKPPQAGGNPGGTGGGRGGGGIGLPPL